VKPAEILSIVLPERAEDALSEGLRALTRHLSESGHGDRCYGLGGEHGYGVEFENDVFLMHPFCWCDKDDCPWCGGCQTDHGDPVHTSECYQMRVRTDLLAEGFVPQEWTQTYVRAPRGWSYERARKIETRVRRKWCEHFGLSYPYRSAVHCTCGAWDDWRRRYVECECDWHKGRGVFRFGPATSAPNFWHKPSDLRVRWYKYIGRSMEVENPNDADIVAVITESILSVPHATD